MFSFNVRIPWLYDNNKDLSIITDKQLEDYKKQAESLDIMEQAEKAKHLKTVIEEDLVPIFGPDSLISIEIVKKLQPPPVDIHWRIEFKKFADSVIQAREKKNNAVVQHAKAILWLKGHGKDPGVHYDPTKAVDIANEIAYQEEINRRIENKQPITVDCGREDGEDCSWDGDDSRCNCRNRKFYWSKESDHSFEHPSIYPSSV